VDLGYDGPLELILESSHPRRHQGRIWDVGTLVSSRCEMILLLKLIVTCSTSTSQLVFNGYDVPFDSTFAQAHSDACIDFQQFSKLSVTGAGNYETWLSLLISTGDPERPVVAADCASTVTAARASTLFNAGYRTVGRYLSNVANTTLNKKIQPGELGWIFGAGLKVFPLFETSGDYLEYFSHDQGVEDARQAVKAATGYGFRRGTVIYFAVRLIRTSVLSCASDGGNPRSILMLPTMTLTAA
jgi:peptidoglycan hydrolase-like protein with peptidoglycan-binding domain